MLMLFPQLAAHEVKGGLDRVQRVEAGVAAGAPARIPMSRDEYTSLVISASAIAMIGGSSVQAVAVRSIPNSPLILQDVCLAPAIPFYFICILGA